MNNEELRREYEFGELRRDDLLEDPIEQFQEWFSLAREADLDLPDAMTLATADGDGTPHARTVVLRGLDEHGFIFFTDYSSQKASQLKENPKASLVFFWREFDRQVRIQGNVQKLSREQAETYFRSRPREAQLSAHTSEQSSAISDRETLEQKYRDTKEKFEDREIPVPENWGGYRLQPAQIEFWQGRPGRLHDRFLYSRTEKGEWNIQRLSP